MKKIFYNILLIFFLFFCSKSFCKTAFENPYINGANKIVFCASRFEHSADVVFSDASSAQPPEILTCFPKKMRMISGEILEIQNDSGIARFSLGDLSSSQGISWVVRDSFSDGFISIGAKSVSPDGKYECVIKKSEKSRWITVIRQIATSFEIILDESPDFSTDSVPAKWSPDSKIVLYEKNGAVYFFDIQASFSLSGGEVQLPESARRIGEGSLSSVEFSGNRFLFFMQDDFVYKIARNELYARTIYSEVTGLGKVSAVLPFRFNPKKDIFFPSPDGEKIALVTNGRVVSVLGVSSEIGGKTTMFSIDEPPSSQPAFSAYWTSGGDALFWVCAPSLSDGFSPSNLHSAFYKVSDAALEIEKMSVSCKFPPAVSPDGKKIAYISAGSLVVKDCATWKMLASFSDEEYVSFAWKNENEIFAGGVFTIKRLGLKSGVYETVFLSGAKEAFWDGDALVAKVLGNGEKSDVFFEYDFSVRKWKNTVGRKNSSSNQNAMYRIFLGESSNPLRENSVFIRNLSSGETQDIFQNISPGSGGKKVSVVIDALDSCGGLLKVLSTLEKFGVKATFFINGEFIRRYPLETRLIAASGHECANMFFTATDLTNLGPFVIDDDFIKRGLSRTEDEFFFATGKEMSLKWHAPFYKASAKMKAAAKKIGYSYSEAGRFLPEPKTHDDFLKSRAHLGTNEIIFRYEHGLSDGGVIYLRLGDNSLRDDSLCEKLDILISSLLEKGFVLGHHSDGFIVRASLNPK